MRLIMMIALRQLLDRKRQSIVSLLGIVLGVSFFLAVSSLMLGSEADFITRLVDNAPHITVSDEHRLPREQPVKVTYPTGAIDIRNLRPLPETRGIRRFDAIVRFLREELGCKASPSLNGPGLISFSGKELGITLNGMQPADMLDVTTVQEHMTEGGVENLISNPDGIIVGAELMRKLALKYGDLTTISTTSGQVRVFKIVGIFRTGRISFDESQVFLDLKRVQALLNRPRRANTIIAKLPNPYEAREIAALIERRFKYKSVSWQESSEDLLNTLTIRNIIMYTVVSSVLIVAGFGIYNVISTVVTEKRRDIAILRAIGFYAHDIERIFVAQGIILGLSGAAIGLPLGSGLMYLLMQVRFTPPGSSQEIAMPIDWGWYQFAFAFAFAMGAALIAATLPARKAGRVQPVEILRGGW